jgi:hypothetical protein
MDTIICKDMVLLSSSVIETSAQPPATRGSKKSVRVVVMRSLRDRDEPEDEVRMTFSKCTMPGMFIG